MRMRISLALLLALTLLGSRPASAQQVPFLEEFFDRAAKFYRLYYAQQRKGVSLSALDPLRKRAENAFRQGSIPSLIEVFAEGQAMLEGKAWDERQRFLSSLTIEVDRHVLEPSQELQISIVRIYPSQPEKAFGSAPTVTVEVVPDPASGRAGATAQPVTVAQRLMIGDVAAVARRRLLLPNGAYSIVATVEAGGQKVGEVRKPLYAIGDFSSRIASLTKRVAAIKSSADPKVKAVAEQVSTPEFQLQRLAPLNRSRSEDQIDAIRELERIEAALAALEKGEDPFAGQRGEMERAYAASDGRLVPYRVYVPSSYDGSSARPLVVLLHGVLGDEKYYFSDMFDAETIKGEAERRGYILAGASSRGRFADYRGPAQQDAFEVMKAIAREYKVDDSRIYLTGHSMGGSGAWLIASQKPEVFAAIAPVSGSIPATGEALNSLLEKLKPVPVLAVAGARDGLVPPSLSKESVSAAQKAGVKATYLEIPEADHITVVPSSTPAVFDFFDKNAKVRSQKSESRSQESESRSQNVVAW